MSRKPEPEPTLVVTRREAARLLCVNERTLQRREADGTLRPLRIGGCVRYKRSDIDDLLRRLAEERQA